MRTVVIGRNPNADVVLAESSVESRHAEVQVTDDGRYYLTDCATTTGTWIAVGARDGQEVWEKTRQSFVAPDQPIRFGGYRCTLKSLLAKTLATGVRAAGAERDSGGAGAPASVRLRGPVERDPQTGEIIRKRL